MMLDMSVVLGLCIYFYIQKSGDIRYVYHQARGLWYESRGIMIGESVVNIVLDIVLGRMLGISGIVFSTVISVFITNYFFCPALLFRLYFQNGKLKEYWIDHFLYTLTMFLTAGVSWCLCEKILPISMIDQRYFGNCLLSLGGRLIFCTIISVLGFWLIWHRSERYQRAGRWMRKMIKL